MMGYVVSLSGGKDSTAMLLMMLDRNEPVDEAVFFDTGWEFPEMYDHIDKLRKTIDVPITTVRAPHTFDYYMNDYVLTKGKYKGQVGLGFPRPFARWCTRLKTQALDKYSKEHGNGRTQCIGIAADENRPTKPEFRYPLIEWGITEAECLKYCVARGFDWGGALRAYDARIVLVLSSAIAEFVKGATEDTPGTVGETSTDGAPNIREQRTRY